MRNKWKVLDKIYNVLLHIATVALCWMLIGAITTIIVLAYCYFAGTTPNVIFDVTGPILICWGAAIFTAPIITTLLVCVLFTTITEMVGKTR